jgi:hypothetical protein
LTFRASALTTKGEKMTTESSKPGLETSGANASRRHLLKLGAIAAPAAMMLKPGHAWAASALTCRVPLNFFVGLDGNNAWRPIAAPPGTLPGAVTTIAPDIAPGSIITISAFVGPPAVGYYTGDQIKSGSLPSAHLIYLSGIQNGDGLSCLVSIGVVP